MSVSGILLRVGFALLALFLSYPIVADKLDGGGPGIFWIAIWGVACGVLTRVVFWSINRLGGSRKW